MAATHPKSQLKGKQPKVAKPKAPAAPKKAQAKQSWKRPAAPAVEGVAIGAAALIPVELLYGVAIGQVSQTVVPDAAGLKVFGIVAGSCTAGRTTVALEKGLTVELPNGELAPCIRVKDAELHGRYGKFVAFESDVANVLERPVGAPVQQQNCSKRRRLFLPPRILGPSTKAKCRPLGPRRHGVRRAKQWSRVALACCRGQRQKIGTLHHPTRPCVTRQPRRLQHAPRRWASPARARAPALPR